MAARSIKQYPIPVEPNDGIPPQERLKAHQQWVAYCSDVLADAIKDMLLEMDTGRGPADVLPFHPRSA